MFNNPYINPYGMGQTYTPPVFPQNAQVVKVNGENGARAYQIGPNSSALLLDESGTLVWLATTDGAGYKTVTAYDITPHQAATAPDYATLEQRIKKLEDMINGYSADSSATGKYAGKPSADQRHDGYGANRREPAGHAFPNDAAEPANEASDGRGEPVWRRP